MSEPKQGPTSDFWDFLGCGLFILLCGLGLGSCDLLTRIGTPSKPASQAEGRQ